MALSVKIKYRSILFGDENFYRCQLYKYQKYAQINVKDNPDDRKIM